MEKLKDEKFENIVISSVTVQDRKLPFWLNVNFTLKRTGQRFKQVKKFSVQREVRSGIISFAKELDNCFGSAYSIAKVNSVTNDVKPVESSDNSADDKENIPPQKRKFSEFEVNNNDHEECQYNNFSEPRCTFSSEQSTFDSNEKAQELPDSPASSEKRPSPERKMDARVVLRTLHLEIMATLQKAISTGNFYALWSGPFIEMENDGISSFVSDTSPYQQAQLIRQATALFYYYE